MSAMWQGCLADTDYFELRSSGGYDYGVWVTTPPGYDPATSPAPAVYVLDGNWAVGMTAPLIVTQLDPMQQIQPYIQVSVGYAGEEAQHWARLRNRDLVPPGERAGEPVLALVGSANRDPEVFDDPDRLDLTREPGRHLSFGLGVHFCLGAPLARMEAAIALTTLSAAPDLALADPVPPYRENLFLRGLASLPVRRHGRAA
ncbi:cytochrome P450 [Nonomuraea wenchangensis]